MAYEETPFDQYTFAGLNQAQNYLTKQPSAYPEYTPSQQFAPVNMQYIDYVGNNPMEKVGAPTYKGMMGGDYDALQSALQQPGQTAATNAYNTGLMNLNNSMGGQGMYGSSIMGNQMNQGLNREYMNAMSTNAANAAAQRYQMQQQDLSDYNKFNTQMFDYQNTQAKDLFSSGMLNSQAQNQYNLNALNWNKSYADQVRDWQNLQNQEKFAYSKEQNAYKNQIDEMMMNRALALAGQGAPLSQAATNYNIALQQSQAARDAANSQANAATTGAYLGAGGTVLGGLLGAGGKTSSNYNVFDWLSTLGS